ncbi:MAG: ATP-dependent metallopeptidase FtsH/Yme1/Tma family protein, partial [Candidatus Obscuribacterales bacterium]
ARVRDLFERAKAKAPCIIFIDELDALGRARGIGPVSGSHDEKEQTLNQLLSELDGFDTTDGVVLLAATNRPEILDPALLRAGRFDRQVLVDRPDKTGRKAILDIHMRGLTRADDIDVDAIAAMTPGFTGADLANLVNEATLLAARRNAEAVTGEDFDQAIERIIAGLEKKNRVLNPEERRVVAFHEMGHALVSMTLPGSESVQKVSIIPRGIGALGYTLQRPTEDRFLMSRQELLDKMAVLMGGRAAESLIFKDISTGAADDFVKATAIARNMVARYGMNKDLGMVAYEEEGSLFLDQPDSYHYPGARMSEETAREIDLGVRELVGKAFERATGILTEKVTALHRGAELLLEKETLQKEELEEIFASDTGSAIRLTNFGVPASSLVEIDSETE